MPPTASDLCQTLDRLDGRSYKAYKDLQGAYTFENFTLHIDHVQGDPFAAPSRLRVVVPQDKAHFPDHTYIGPSRRLALCSYLALRFSEQSQALSRRRGSGKSGLIQIDAPGQQIIERTCISIGSNAVEARFTVGLPASGRRIAGRQAAELLGNDIPHCVAQALFYAALDADEIESWIHTNEDAEALRAQLEPRGLVAFISVDAVLPRRSGVDDRPLQQDAIPFAVPPELAVELDTPNSGPMRGMGIPRGVTLIVGGGFHGKSTLLRALERGVYNHRPQDGRHRSVTVANAIKIRAEDGRRVENVDISPFINGLPFGQDTRTFGSDNASGSTSQAANIIEALEVGAAVLLIDEDTAATNFMIRDARMQRLIAPGHEPITPLVDRVRPLYEEHGVSTIVVAGGSGDYFDVADTVIACENYLPRLATDQARAIAAAYPNDRRRQGHDAFGTIGQRVPLPSAPEPSTGSRSRKVKSRRTATILWGREEIDLAGVEQLVDPSQTRAIAAALLYAEKNCIDGTQTLRQIIDQVQAAIASGGLDILSPYPVGDHAAFRPLELAATLNRLRSLAVKPD
jgi:predicted ABC-class ATPase